MSSILIDVKIRKSNTSSVYIFRWYNCTRSVSCLSVRQKGLSNKKHYIIIIVYYGVSRRMYRPYQDSWNVHNWQIRSIVEFSFHNRLQCVYYDHVGPLNLGRQIYVSNTGGLDEIRDRYLKVDRYQTHVIFLSYTKDRSFLNVRLGQRRKKVVRRSF